VVSYDGQAKGRVVDQIMAKTGTLIFDHTISEDPDHTISCTAQSCQLQSPKHSTMSSDDNVDHSDDDDVEIPESIEQIRDEQPLELPDHWSYNHENDVEVPDEGNAEGKITSFRSMAMTYHKDKNLPSVLLAMTVGIDEFSGLFDEAGFNRDRF